MSKSTGNTDEPRTPQTARVLANFGEALAIVLDEPQIASEPGLSNDNKQGPDAENLQSNPHQTPEPGEVRRAVPLKKLPLLVAGDKVECEAGVDSTMRATRLIDRTSELSRPDRRGHLKAVAANITQLVIVCAPRPRPDALLIDQFCVVAGNQRIRPLIVLNKSDLIDSKLGPSNDKADGNDQAQQQASYDECRQLLDAYQEAGFKTLLINTLSADGASQMRQALSAHTSVLVGQSGVGKSSIIQRILPDREIRVGAVSTATGLGAHTTTVSFFYDLDHESALIDSPGVRQFSVDYLEANKIEEGFPEIQKYAEQCRFQDCRHAAEPGCAVNQAVKENNINHQRFSNYQKLCSVADNTPVRR